MATVNAMSDYLEERIAKHVLRGVSYTSPSTLYLALFKSPVTSAALEAGTITSEVTGGGYARQVIVFNNPTNPGGVSTNNGVVTFPTATASWGTITHFAIMDSLTAGNVLIYGELDIPKAIEVDDVLQLPNTNLSITIS